MAPVKDAAEVTEEVVHHAQDGVELTEFEAIEVHQVKGVGKGANGFPHLLLKGLAAPAAEPAEPAEVPAGRPAWHAAAAALARMGARVGDVDPAILFKAVNASGEVDEGPDIDGGKQAIALIAKLIGYEAQELEAGCLDETYDIALLLEAAQALRCWLSCEQMARAITADTETMAGKSEADAAAKELAAAEDVPMCGFTYGTLDGVTKDSRTFTAAERKKHAKDGNALEDGSYPIPDKDALRRAAILARSGHGDVKAAKRLIARRAKELGVANPLDTDDKATSKATAGPVVAEEATAVDTEAIEAAVTKALGPYEERIDALESAKTGLETANKALGDELAKVLALPRAGGPVLSAAALRGAPKADGTDHAAKAAYYEDQALKASDASDADAYRQLAAQERNKITAQ